MPDPFVGHFCRVEFGKAAVETGIAVYHFEIVYRHDLYFVRRRDIREAHVLTVPLQLAVQSL